MDLYIENNYIEFIDMNTNKVIQTFSRIPQPGQTIDWEGNVLTDKESEECEDPMLYYDINGSYLEAFSNDIDKNGEVEFTFSLKDSIDVTDIVIGYE